MFFENEITKYYKYNFEIIDLNEYIFSIMIIWTICKIIFYIIPTLILLRSYDREQEKNIGTKISKFKKLCRSIIIFSLVIPLFDCFVFFYIVVGLIGRVKGQYPKTVIACQIYGISAGILNVVIISNFQNLIMFSSGIIFTNQSEFFIAFNVAVLCSWALLSVNHLFYLYSLNAEILQKLLHPALFSDYEKKGYFTADHL